MAVMTAQTMVEQMELKQVYLKAAIGVAWWDTRRVE